MDIVLEKLLAVASSFLILSLVVERIADFIKLRSKDLRTKFDRTTEPDKEKEREKGIVTRSIIIGVLVALALKADCIQMFVSGEPGEVLGWENVLMYEETTVDQFTPANYYYFKALTLQETNAFGFLYRWVQVLIGITLTGFALSFGSKFWHDLVGLLYEIKEVRAKITTGNGK